MDVTMKQLLEKKNVLIIWTRRFSKLTFFQINSEKLTIWKRKSFRFVAIIHIYYDYFSIKRRIEKIILDNLNILSLLVEERKKVNSIPEYFMQNQKRTSLLFISLEEVTKFQVGTFFQILNF